MSGTPYQRFRMRLVELTALTISDSGLFFADAAHTPRLALTMGLGTIMEARRVLLLATGHRKARIVARAFRGKVTPRVPASVLQRHHLMVIVDQEAGRRLGDETDPLASEWLDSAPRAER